MFSAKNIPFLIRLSCDCIIVNESSSRKIQERIHVDMNRKGIIIDVKTIFLAKNVVKTNAYYCIWKFDDIFFT